MGNDRKPLRAEELKNVLGGRCWDSLEAALVLTYSGEDHPKIDELLRLIRTGDNRFLELFIQLVLDDYPGITEIYDNL